MAKSEVGVGVTVPHPVTGAPVKGTNLPITKAVVPVSTFELADGTRLKVTLALLSAVRLDGEIGPDGSPMMTLNFSPTIEKLAAKPERSAGVKK